MFVSAPTALKEYRIRADLVEAARIRAGQTSVTLSYVVARAMRAFLESGAPAPVFTRLERVRLAVRLPVELVAELDAEAEARAVAPRVLVEGALQRSFVSGRPARWDPNRPSDGPDPDLRRPGRADRS